jgi:hypothetical protein
MSQSKREQVVSHLRYIRQELREMHQGVMEDGLLPEAGEVRDGPEHHEDEDGAGEVDAEHQVRELGQGARAELTQRETRAAADR